MKDKDGGFWQSLILAVGFCFCCVAVTAIAICGRGSETSFTQIGVLLSMAIGAATFIKSHFERQDLKNDIKYNTVKTEAGLAKAEAISVKTESLATQVEDVRIDVVKAANGLSDRRAAEAKAAGKAEGIIEGTTSTLAKVAAVAPDVVPAVAAKLP